MKECNQCGKCCIKYGNGALSASAQDIEMWALFDPHIFKYVQNNEIWVDPNTGKKLETCPFLVLEPKRHDSTANNATANNANANKYTCGIYESRPEDCRHYPSLISEMIKDECEMIEVTDFDRPKQAQIKLDWIMRDSRPYSR